MQSLAARFIQDDSGATSMEYGLISALVAVAIIVAARALGSQVAATFGKASTGMKNG